MICFTAYSITLLALAVIFRPKEDSKILAAVNEFVDETLTEIDEDKKITSGRVVEIEMKDRRLTGF